MSKSISNVFSAAILLTFTCLLTAAQDATPTLPTGEEVMARLVEASGGKAALDKLQNVVMKGKMKMPAMNIEGTIETWAARPVCFYMDVKIANIEHTEQGVNDGVAWSTSLLQGPRILEGEEKEILLREARFDNYADWKSDYTEINCLREEKHQGKDCLVLELTPKIGKPITLFVDKSTGLPAGSRVTMKTQMGEITTESRMIEYKKVGDLTWPATIEQVVMGQIISLTFDSFEYNVEIPAGKFDLPAAVKALLDQPKESPATPEAAPKPTE